MDTARPPDLRTHTHTHTQITQTKLSLGAVHMQAIRTVSK